MAVLAGSSVMKKIVTAHNARQKQYTYELVEPVGKHFDPDFKPDLTPEEMLTLGVFEGGYTTVNCSEFPKKWFRNARRPKDGKEDCSWNYFGVCASQPHSVWLKKGWINKKHDPSGWFQWYCRYYMGRRLPDEDTRQIKRWKAFRRHLAQVAHNCRTGDIHCRPRQRQALLHWAYDSRNI